ncbi:MAG: NADP-specific glutamate dehydrogenase [Planctomycetota bacterium]
MSNTTVPTPAAPPSDVNSIGDLTDVLMTLVEGSCHGPLFKAAAEEVASAIGPVLGKEDSRTQSWREHRVFDRLLEPDRIVRFRVEWVDDEGKPQINRAWRVEHTNVIGPYKGGLRFRHTVTEDTLSFLAYEQCFKNALTGLPLGGGKGGSDFEPKGKSEGEVMRFCQGFMTELSKYIGPDEDVPAGDIGVGGREIGFMYGRWLKLTKKPVGVLTGKPLQLGGLPGREEATGYGTVAFAKAMLEQAGGSMDGARVAISGAGNVSLFAAERALERGAQVVSVSDSGGALFCDGGLTREQLDEIMTLKLRQRGKLSDYSGDGVEYNDGGKPWGMGKYDVALPCATQNEIEDKDAEAIADAGGKYVAEGANMPCTHGAKEVFNDRGVTLGPGKAANAGGVGMSGFEMAQNSGRVPWTKERAIDELETMMARIHEQCVEFGQTNDKGGDGVDYEVGANRAGFAKLADAVVAVGVG